jgi:hypothetical protein
MHASDAPTSRVMVWGRTPCPPGWVVDAHSCMSYRLHVGWLRRTMHRHDRSVRCGLRWWRYPDIRHPVSGIPPGHGPVSGGVAPSTVCHGTDLTLEASASGHLPHRSPVARVRVCCVCPCSALIDVVRQAWGYGFNHQQWEPLRIESRVRYRGGSLYPLVGVVGLWHRPRWCWCRMVGNLWLGLPPQGPLRRGIAHL